MEFIYEKDGMKIKFIYSAKDFVAIYNSSFGEMKYALHMMFMCPMKYSEEMLRERHCPSVAQEFMQLEKFLSENPNFIEDKKSELEKLLDEIKSRKEIYVQTRREMKKQFKEGKISEIDYKRFCKDVKNCDYEIWKTKADFIHQLQISTGVDIRLLKEFGD